ncbi:NfeD family protein [Aliikangiella sp. IMCC44359]|uniref:NfeD family protein n=1 Tax=Aliikangiella sp. IMCC44359 TaxID=3459125 RepID=UPI00403A9832
MIDYIVHHQAEFWIVLGFLLLAIEVITGFVSGIFLFVGLGALVSGGLMGLGLLPESWIAGGAGTGISTGLLTIALWKPFKRLQGDKPIAKDNSSDLVGYQFIVDKDVKNGNLVTTSYSGISWKVEIDPEVDITSIESGTRVEVTSVEVGMFKVKPV